MQEKNLEEKVGLYEQISLYEQRGIRSRAISYLTAAALALGALSSYSCATAGTSPGYSSGYSSGSSSTSDRGNRGYGERERGYSKDSSKERGGHRECFRK